MGVGGQIIDIRQSIIEANANTREKPISLLNGNIRVFQPVLSDNASRRFQMAYFSILQYLIHVSRLFLLNFDKYDIWWKVWKSWEGGLGLWLRT